MIKLLSPYPFNSKHLADVESEDGDILGVVSSPHQVGGDFEGIPRLEEIGAGLALA